MKTVIVIVILAFAASCSADYSEIQKEAITKNSNICKKELFIPAESNIQQQTQYGDLTLRDDIFKQYVSCIMLKFGFMDKDGVLNAKELIEFMVPNYNRDAVAEVMDACSQTEGESLEDKAYSFYYCFNTKKNFEI